ncbi:MAG TPA: AsmA family protein [Terriglobales bacterium]
MSSIRVEPFGDASLRVVRHMEAISPTTSGGTAEWAQLRQAFLISAGRVTKNQNDYPGFKASIQTPSRLPEPSVKSPFRIVGVLTMRKFLKISGALVVVLILIALALPFFISANTFKPKLESELSGALGRQAEMGNLRLSLRSGSVAVDSFSVADDPAFSSSPFLTAQQLRVGVSLLPLIFSRRLEVTSLTIADPQVRLLRAPSGRWNYSSLGASSGSTASPAHAAPLPGGNFSVGELKLSHGSMTVADVGSSKVRKYENVSLEASNVSYSSEFPFHFTAGTPGGGTVKMDGKAGPIDSTDASLTPFNLRLTINNLDLASTGFIDPSSGMGGRMGFDGSLGSNGQQATSQGRLQAEKVRLAPDATPATVPVTIDYATTYDLRRSAGLLTQGEIHIGKALATLAGAYDMAGATTTLDMKMDGTAMPATDLQGVFPAVGLILPKGAALQSGTLDAALKFSGPVDAVVIAGQVKLANARMTGFNLGGELGALASFAGLGKSGTDTEIQTLSSNVRVDTAGTNFENMNLIVPAIGTLTGHGTISARGQLNCHMTAHLASNTVTSAVGNAVAQSQIGRALGGALASLTGGGGAGSGAKGGIGIPFNITGTTAKPIFTPTLTPGG